MADYFNLSEYKSAMMTTFEQLRSYEHGFE